MDNRTARPIRLAVKEYNVIRKRSKMGKEDEIRLIAYSIWEQ